MVSNNGIYVDPSKIKAVKNWKAPKTPLEIRSFMGLAAYYRRFIANFSKIVKPFTLLIQKNQKYEWGVKQEEAFQTLKDKLCNAPILSLPNGAEDFVVYYDASNQGLGCVLIDYDCEIRYHPGKANVVADALSRKERVKPKRVRAMSMMIYSGIKEKLLAAQSEATKEESAQAEMLCSLDQQMEKKGDGGLYFIDRIWIPLIGNVRTMIIDEAHATRYSIHPGAGKMYYDLRDMYWWPSMKRDIATYVSKCLTCSKVKSEHQRSSVDRLNKSAHFLAIREDYSMEKLSRLYIDEIVVRHGVPVSIISDRDADLLRSFGRPSVIDFGGSWDTHLPLAEFSYNNSYHSSIRCAPFEALYKRKFRSHVLWAEVGDNRLIGPKMVQETIDKVILIKERLKAARDRQKSYADNRREPIEFEVDIISEVFGKCKYACAIGRNKVDKTLCFVEEPVEIMDRKD
ncbi:putative reverse transcriptase domain-containing protein [Tanacetum coccineum]